RWPWLKPVGLIVAVVAVLVAARVFGLGERLGELRVWIESLGAWGPIAYALIYGVATALAVPASVLTVAAGAIFGSVVGVAVVSVGATLGATLAFLLARSFARGAVERWLADNERFAKLDAMVEKHGAIVVAITRLVPIFPFNLLNYGFGLTKVGLGTYVFWSWLCMLPGTVLYVVGADAVTRGLAEGRVPWALVGVVVVALAILALVVRRARRVLAQREAAAEVKA
ncbi:MAG: TVP38/TMEM64 family protein, partial [Thermoanaerobaculia bacterium]